MRSTIGKAAIALFLTIVLEGGVRAADPAQNPTAIFAARTVDPSAFRDKPAYDRKRGEVANPAIVAMIEPGMNKDAIYRLVGAPHFGEVIARRWNYILNFGASDRAPALRCRMEVVFAKPDYQPITSNHTAVAQVVWQNQACADRVAAAR